MPVVLFGDTPVQSTLGRLRKRLKENKVVLKVDRLRSVGDFHNLPPSCDG